MPGRVPERRIDIRPGARVIDQDHEADSGAAEDIEGVVALQGGCLGWKSKYITAKGIVQTTN